MPPARDDSRRYSLASASQLIASCATLPRPPATVMPSPISTAFIAWMLISACASSPSMRRSQCTCEPRPGGTPKPSTSTHAAERVAGLRRFLDLADHLGLGVGIEAAHLRRCRPTSRSSGPGRRSGDAAAAPSCTTWLSTEMPRWREQRLGERAGRDPRRGLARARALEHVAGVGEAVLLHAREVGVARAGAG